MITNTSGQYYGTVVLDDCGSALIILPETFPDAKRMASLSLLFKPFTVIYHLTAVGKPMPNLHVGKEVFRFNDYQGKRSKSNDAKTVDPVIGNNMHIHKNQDGILANELYKNKLRPMDPLDGIKARQHVSTTIIKSASFSAFENYDHNDRLIDGPLPSFSLSNASVFVRKRLQDLRNLSNNLKESSSDQSIDTKSDASLHQDPASKTEDKLDMNKDTDHSKVGLLDRSPLCFAIKGGIPHGKVSWQVITVPKSDEAKTHANQSHGDWRSVS